MAQSEREENSDPQNPERKGSIPIGIFEETAPLRSVAVWGSIGAKGVLAGLYPPEVSLFYSNMNVPKARSEAEGLASTLAGMGVEVVCVRDRLADAFYADFVESGAEVPTFEDIRDGLFQKAELIIAQNQILTTRALEAELDEKLMHSPYLSIDNFPDLRDSLKRRRRSLVDAKSDIVFLLEADIKRYGEAKALVFTKVLCLDPEMPLGNSLYARDQMNVLLNRRVSSTMAKPIRRGEVRHYERVYQDILGLGEPIVIPEGETFEGGDAYVHNGVVYVGVGPRTTKNAAIHIFEQLEPDLRRYGFKFAMVVDPDPVNRPEDEQMDFMHLDTFSMPIGLRQIVVCKEEGERRRVSFLARNDGVTQEIATGQNFQEHLQAIGDEVIVLSGEEQKRFGANFLVLDQDRVMVPRDDNQDIIAKLVEAGKEVVHVPLKECTNGYGAAHCMVAQLSRG